MYNDPRMYAYYSNANAPINHLNRQGNYPQLVEALLTGIRREASDIDFYSRLSNEAPNQKHKDVILYVAEGKKFYLQQFTDLYAYLTGSQPEYEVDKVTFRSYREGLEKAYAAEAEGYQEYRNSYFLSQHPLVQHVFSWAFSAKSEYAARFAVLNDEVPMEINDYGGKPFVVNINEATRQNNTYRTALWTGKHLQVTLMSINVGDDIGLEVHPTTDQFLRIEEGQGLIQMGDSKDHLDFEQQALDDYAIMVPAGKWHNVTNTGDKPLKIYAIYAPPEHPFGTVQEMKEDAIATEEM